jgi:hypothetical protein
MFKFLRDLVRNLISKKNPNPAPLPVIPASTQYIDILVQMKHTCSATGKEVCQQSGDYLKQAEGNFQEFHILQEQLEQLIDLAEAGATQTGEIARQAEFIQAQQSRLSHQGLWYQDMAQGLSALAEEYSKIVIDLYLCVRKLQSFEQSQANMMGENLLLAFRVRQEKLQQQYQQLCAPSQTGLPAELVNMNSL